MPKKSKFIQLDISDLPENENLIKKRKARKKK